MFYIFDDDIYLCLDRYISIFCLILHENISLKLKYLGKCTPWLNKYVFV